jgi:hypothetical protein
MRIEGMPHFQQGERALLFLRGKAEHASVVGMAQGKRPVSRETGRWMVSAPDRDGADFVRTTPASGSIFKARPRPLEELHSHVRSLVGAGARSGAR